METAAQPGDRESEPGSDPGVPEPATAAGGAETGTATADAAERAPKPPSVLDRIQDDLDGVERALQRLDEGSYGTCEVCGAPLGDDQLAARPIARSCPAHQPTTTLT